MNAKIKKILNTILVILILSPCIISQTYYTINDGDWTNTTNVWSLDGITACSCSPPSDINGFDIIIRHIINMNVDINMLNASDSVIIKSSGRLNNFSFLINVTTGVLFSETTSILNIKDLIVGLTGKAELYGNIVTQTKWSVDGILNLYAQARIIDENFEIKSTATVTLHPGAEIILDNKDLIIDGTLNINSACITVQEGNVENKGSGIVTGIGLITTLNGDILNLGSWAITVEWCAAGSGTGLPHPENCIITCESIMPIELSKFVVKTNSNKVDISWSTNIEINNDFFTVERSINGIDFEEFINIPGAGNSEHILFYATSDLNPYSGTSYYRLKQTDFDGTFTYSSLKAISVNPGTKLIFQIFPNPASDQINIKINTPTEEGYSIRIYNVAGKIVNQQLSQINNNNQLTQLRIADLDSGYYIIELSNHSFTQQHKFIKQ